MVVLDVVLIVWRWQEEINFFVLIAMSLAAILFVVGYILSKQQPKEANEKPAPVVEKVEEKPQPKEEPKPVQNQNPNKGNNNNKGNGKGKKQGGKKSNGKKYSTTGKK